MELSLSKTGEFLKKYKHAWILSYFFVYMVWFLLLEEKIKPRYWMHSPIDDFIPFVPIFIIPYAIWVFYVAGLVVFFLFTSKNDYYKLCAYLFIGMSICLTIYMIFPNGQKLRPDLSTMPETIWIRMIARLYASDTPTNVAPSIHTYNSIGIHIAILMSERLRKINWLKITSFVLMVLIIMSTVCLKQHSIDDVFFALPLNLIMYLLVYKVKWPELIRRISYSKKRSEEKL